MHKQLSGHSNIVKYVDASFINHANSAKAYAEYLLVSELCKGGSLIDCMGTSFEPDAILKIVYQITKSIGHMHCQNPPITHRDIKVGVFHWFWYLLRSFLSNSLKKQTNNSDWKFPTERWWWIEIMWFWFGHNWNVCTGCFLVSSATRYARRSSKWADHLQEE